jgi:hypothetical protein
MKCGSRTIIRGCPKTAAMALDDGAADEQPDAHAVTLGRVQRLEQSFRIPRMEAYLTDPSGFRNRVSKSMSLTALRACSILHETREGHPGGLE